MAAALNKDAIVVALVPMKHTSIRVRGKNYRNFQVRMSALGLEQSGVQSRAEQRNRSTLAQREAAAGARRQTARGGNVTGEEQAQLHTCTYAENTI